MNAGTEITPEFISRAVNEVRKIKPDYQLLLDLYERIFIAQEGSKSHIQLAEYRIPGELLSVKLEGKFPLVTITQFSFDRGSAGVLFTALCGILRSSNECVSESAGRIGEAVERNDLDMDKLFPAFLSDNRSYFSTLEKDLKLDLNILRFLVYNSLKPSLNIFSAMMERYLDREGEWDKGYCPVCGSMPELSIFEENGKRSLLCGFCGRRWQSKRVYCPSCENTDHESLHYFEIEDKEEYRVDVCEKCKSYIKTVDIKKMSRPVYFPLESIATPYIVVKFKEMGYKPVNETIDR